MKARGASGGQGGWWAAVCALVLLAAFVRPPHDPDAQYRAFAWRAPMLAAPAMADASEESPAPTRGFWFGTDQFGRDLFSRFLAGARTSLGAAALAAGVTIALALALGLVAALVGGLGDAVLMTAADLTTALPWMVVMLAVRAALPLELSVEASLAMMSLVIAVASWPRPARHVRALVQQLQREDFVLAAWAGGASRRDIVWRHALPALWPLALERFALLLPRAIVAEVTLSALGLGLSEPHASWGTLVASLQRAATLGSYWWTILPLTAMFVLLWLVTHAAENFRVHASTRTSA